MNRVLRRRWLPSSLLALVLLFTFAACSEETPTPEPPAGPTITATSAGVTTTPTPTPTPTATATVSATAETSVFPLTVEMTDGETLTLEAPPERIVSLSAYATDVLCAIGAGDQVVAVEQFANCPAGGEDKPALDAFVPNVEAIAGYKPDLVYVSDDIDGLVAALRRLKIPVVYLAIPNAIDDVLARIDLFGQVTGHEEEATALRTSIEERISTVEAKVKAIAAAEKPPRIYHELDPSFFTVGPGSFIDELYSRLGAENIAADVDSPYPQLTAEAIVAADPQVIILADEPSGVTPAAVAERPGWDKISAVVDGRVCVVDPSLLSQPGPRIADALEALAKCVYPDQFGG